MQAVLERLRSASIDWSGGGGGGKHKDGSTGAGKCRNSTPPSTQRRAAAPVPPSTQQPDANPGRKAPLLVLTPPSLFQPGHESGILNEGDLEEVRWGSGRVVDGGGLLHWFRLARAWVRSGLFSFDRLTE